MQPKREPIGPVKFDDASAARLDDLRGRAVHVGAGPGKRNRAGALISHRKHERGADRRCGRGDRDPAGRGLDQLALISRQDRIADAGRDNPRTVKGLAKSPDDGSIDRTIKVIERIANLRFNAGPGYKIGRAGRAVIGWRIGVIATDRLARV